MSKRVRLTPEERERLGEVLRAARHAAGLSLSQISEAMEIDRSYIPRIEAGRIEVSIATVQRFARACGTTVIAILRKAGIK